MEGLSAYYDDLSREFLDLLDYHKKCLLYLEESGKHDPERRKKLEIFDQLRELVYKRARERKKTIEREKAKQDKLMKDRMHAICHNCHADRPVEITGEEEEELFGFLCDTVKCTACGSEFTNSLPNNWEDRIAYYNCMMEIMLNAKKLKIKGLKSTMSKKEINETLENIRKFADAQKLADELEKVSSEAEQKSEEIFISMYNKLLLAKIKGITWNDFRSFNN
jgi:hypothetical protein